MQILRDVPLRRKLRVISMLSSGVALLLACGAFVTYELVTFREAMVEDLSSAAAIIGYNSSAALLFDDADSATRTLQSFSTHENVVGAALYDGNGIPFAKYQRSERDKAFDPPAAEPAGYRFEDNRLKLFYPFDLAGEHAGTVYIESGVENLESRMARYGLIAALVMLASAGVASLLAALLQRGISGPISDLAGVVNVVKTKNNYSVRARKAGSDELGSLIDGFNAMLDQIQMQDGALQDARDHLERRVAERTRELLQEIGEREAAQAELEETHQQLLEASRQAGMAEVATNVLHNVGNVLNSVNVSAAVIAERANHSRVSSISKLAELLCEHADDLGGFLATDPRGKQIPRYLSQLAEHLVNERSFTLKELDLLRNNIDHIKSIVAMQQNLSKVSGVRERVNVVDLLEDALRINDPSLQRHDVEIAREYGPVPELTAEKHKILQILVNLVRNAKDACKVSPRADKQITLRVASGDGRVRISVIDNGVGIPPENMKRIFAHGFTTKQHGHGYGLHSGALAARELGGSLDAESEGTDRGAVFTLVLPVEAPEQATDSAAIIARGLKSRRSA